MGICGLGLPRLPYIRSIGTDFSSSIHLASSSILSECEKTVKLAVTGGSEKITVHNSTKIQSAVADIFATPLHRRRRRAQKLVTPTMMSTLAGTNWLAFSHVHTPSHATKRHSQPSQIKALRLKGQRQVCKARELRTILVWVGYVVFAPSKAFQTAQGFCCRHLNMPS